MAPVSDFETELLALTGGAEDSHDIRAMVRRCFLYDFVDAPVRLWDGQGRLKTEDGNTWIGTIDALGNNQHSAPAVRDDRDGSSPRYEFGIPYLDAATYAALKPLPGLARGRDLICYHAVFAYGEGLRPLTPIRFNYRLAMKDVTFSERVDGDVGSMTKVYAASVIAKSLEYGRSRTPAGTMTSTAQNQRARLLGLDSDAGCDFVADLANRTFTVEGG